MQAPTVVLGPGTGLGEAYLTWNDALDAYTVWPSGMINILFGSIIEAGPPSLQHYFNVRQCLTMSPQFSLAVTVLECRS